jgi:hypothetical protein
MAMDRWTRRLIGGILLAGGVALSVSCGHDAAEAGGGEPSPQRTQRIKSGDLLDDDSTRLADKYGSINPLYAGKEGERLDEAGKVNQRFTGEFGKRQFDGKRYDKKAFWGDKAYAKKVYGGETDGDRFLRSAREGGREAGVGERMSREAGRGYDRGREFGGPAREHAAAPVERTSDAETDVRRRVFREPEVRQAGERRALTVEDTRSMLGR